MSGARILFPLPLWEGADEVGGRVRGDETHVPLTPPIASGGGPLPSPTRGEG